MVKAVILAAGEGRRLRPLTRHRPKPMLPVANKPVIEYVVEAVTKAGIDDVILVVGYERDRIQTHMGNGDEWDIDIEYVIQDDQLGTGHAVQQAEPLVDEEFLVLNGDRIIDPSLVERIASTPETNTSTEATMAVTRVDSPEQYGIVVTDDGPLRIEEKPVTEPSSNVINAGVYRFTPTIFETIRDSTPSPDGEIHLPNAITKLATEDTVETVRYDDRWLDVTDPWDLLSVNDELVPEQPTTTNQIHNSATVTDHTQIGKGTVVGPNATIERGTALGPNVTVGSNAVVSNAVVMQDARIANGAVVRDCIVDENATIGPNVTVSGGPANVTVGTDVHRNVTLGAVVGAHTEIGGGTVLSPGSIVGNNVTVQDGTHVDERIESNATVYRS